MPTKLNRAGNQQNYVPAGNGDASGEYGDNATGSNKNFTTKKQEPENPTRKLVLEKNGFDPDNMSEKQKQETFVRLGGEDNWANKAYDANEEDMKSIDYTKRFVQNETFVGYFGNERTLNAEVKITRGSLSKDEIGDFNRQLQELFDRYPDMQKFNKILVKNAQSSTQGGYIKTYSSGNNKAYELYINAGWLDKTPGERATENNIAWYKRQIAYNEEQIAKINQNPQDFEDAEERKARFLEATERMMVAIDREKNKEKEIYNVIYKFDNRKERLKSLMAHELMHRITNYNLKSPELYDEARSIFSKAKENGDAKNISTYATTSLSEFLSEANAQIECGLETPKYIVDLVNKVKGGR